MPQDKLDLAQGSVLHIKAFSSRGHPAKNKFLFVIGRRTESEVLGFLISSQLAYLKRDSHKNEVVRIPDRSTSFLRCESIIQCFELESLSISSLQERFEAGSVTHEGRLPARYLYKVRDIVSKSELLSQVDIDKVLRVLPAQSQS